MNKTIFSTLAVCALTMSGPITCARAETPENALYLHLWGNSHRIEDDRALDMDHANVSDTLGSWALELHDVKHDFTQRPMQYGLAVHSRDYAGVIIKAAELTAGLQFWKAERRNLTLNGTVGLGLLNTETWFDEERYPTALVRLDLQLRIFTRWFLNVSPYHRATPERRLDGDVRDMTTSGVAFGVAFKLL